MDKDKKGSKIIGVCANVICVWYILSYVHVYVCVYAYVCERVCVRDVV